MTYTVRVTRRVERQLRGLDQVTQQRIRERMRTLVDDPRPAGTKKLAASDHEYRLRVGNYRILYEIHDRQLLVLVVQVGHRGAVYRP